jgi:hypothetical protein
MPKIKKTTKKAKKTLASKFAKKTTNLVAVKPKSKTTNSLTLTKQQEIKKLVSAYQQVGISLTKLLKTSK